MKNIQVSDQMYDFLMDISMKMNTQDSRSTPFPFMYILTELVQRPAVEGSGEEIVIDEKGIEWSRNIFDDWDEAVALITYCGWNFKRETPLSEEEFKVKLDEMLDEELEEYLVSKKGYKQYFSTINREIVSKDKTNVFFTEKAARDHLQRNKHHYWNGQEYGISGWRNPELEMIHKFLKGLTAENIYD